MKLKSYLLCSLLAACVSDDIHDQPPGDGAQDEEPGPDEGGSTVCEPSQPKATKCEAPEVHVFGIYEASSDHTIAGEATVRLDRPGTHILVLSSYEATQWKIELGCETKLSAIHLLGYEVQSVEPPHEGIEITNTSYAVDGEFPGCGFAFPDNGDGCDTAAMLTFAAQRAGHEVTTFQGCYQGHVLALDANLEATGTCLQSEISTFRAPCTASTWEALDFAIDADPSSCTGSKFVTRNDAYGLFVGAQLCGSADRYKLYASETRDGMFRELADFGGHGQDHCELVNPAFTLPDEDDITSGGCAACETGDVVDVRAPRRVWARATFGQPFELVTASEGADLTTQFYGCGIAIP